MRNVLILMALVLMCGLPAQAQQIVGRSEAVALDFGFPRLRVLDDIQFLDENDNNRIDPGESCLISFTVENYGRYPAHKVSIRPEELNKLAGLEMTSSVEVGDLEAGEKRRVQVGITAADKLQEGTASLVFSILEDLVSQNVSVVFAVGVKKELSDD